MVENPTVGSKFRPFSTHVTVSLPKFSCTATALILNVYLNATESTLFQHFRRFCKSLDDHFFHLLPLSRFLL
jgi:hypothetical protein